MYVVIETPLKVISPPPPSFPPSLPPSLYSSLSPSLPLVQLLWVFEHLAAITSQPAETPNERNFQAQYGETINSALQRLRSPLNYATPHTVWEPFKEVSWKCVFHDVYVRVPVCVCVCGYHT